MKLCVGAYAASPSASGWNLENETAFYAGLRSMPFISGLEIPFLGTLHAQDPEWFLHQLSPDWNSVLTPIPGVMNTLAKDAHFGLASADAGGRARALEFMQKLHAGLCEMNAFFGRQVVSAVEVHSAPTLGKPGVTSSAECFAQSLSELRSWDWQGAHLCIEHCDRFIEGQTPAKGFLSLEEEIQSIQQSSGTTPTGILINWGRSAIEGRSNTTPYNHAQAAKKAGVLSGLIFSGCTVNNSMFGSWADSHAPFETEGSLLTKQVAQACVQACDAHALRVFGLKMQALPKSLGVAERLKFIEDNARFCQELVQ